MLAEQGAPQRVLCFDAPAERFTESCVLGNGRLGAMLFGRVNEERVVLNEAGMWSGSPQQADRPEAHEALPEIRRLLLAGQNHQAEQLVNEAFTCAGVGSGQGQGKSTPYGCYQTLGDLRLEFPHGGSPATGYRRTLRLADARATVDYTIDGVRHTREALASAPDDAIVVRLTASEPAAISFAAWLDRPERATLAPHGGDTLELYGQLEDGFGTDRGVRYAARLRVVPVGGRVRVDGGRLRVDGADEALVFVTAATDIDSFAGRPVDDARAAAADDLRAASGKTWGDLAARQAADHRRWFDRAWLRVGPPANEAEPAPIAERIAAEGPPEAELVATLFDYGRYLLIGSSRPGGFPANLQGIWAEELQTPWNADWHANVNVQMNYWPAEPCNLSRLHEPLFALVESLVEPGRGTAQAYYKARGWVAHLLMNPWGFTSPGESAKWGSTPTCSAWMCWRLWDHYLYTGDRGHLRRVYPTLRDAAAFYADMLIEEPRHGWLVTAPSNSPENAFIDSRGRTVHTCMGPAIDQQLLRFLFDVVITSSELLGESDPLVDELRDLLPRLAPTQIGDDGRVMEWLRQREEAEPDHRHVSHLWGLYPGMEIDRQATPDLAAAAWESLHARGDGGTGWAIAYKACLWARLGEGDRALALLGRLLRPADDPSEAQRWNGGVYPNLLVAHPPYQIDGNFGATAAVAEMLVQSRYDTPDGAAPAQIDLLPALPAAWSEGQARGLRARGGVTVGLSWSDGQLASATLTSHWAPSARVRYRGAVQTIDLPRGEPVEISFDQR
ncbi:glycoside hydrolase family 95 protein [Botrimarina sp.]|uniref:glycoside hydrolase family 95 protein n=1 Tax=Botrimarina sp. TaxID=2795802 RepID=UPI0032EC00C0